MKPLPISAVGSYAQAVPEQPDSLRERVRAVCPTAPRRVNRIIELALLGAHTCVGGRVLPTDTPIYMAFTSGCIADSAAVVKQVAEGRPPMPLMFINVSSNMAGFYVAGSLGLHSGNQVVANRDFGWEAALELAMLGSAHSRGLLLGAVEECAWPLDEHRQRLGLQPGATLLECSHWLLGDRTGDDAIATIQWVKPFPSRDALIEELRARRLPPDTRLAVSAPPGAEPGAWREALQLPVWARDRRGHSGLDSAAACCEFIQNERGSLLLLNVAADGRCCAVLVTASATSKRLQ